jgi:hypothetical protein
LLGFVVVCIDWIDAPIFFFAFEGFLCFGLLFNLFGPHLRILVLFSACFSFVGGGEEDDDDEEGVVDTLATCLLVNDNACHDENSQKCTVASEWHIPTQ